MKMKYLPLLMLSFFANSGTLDLSSSDGEVAIDGRLNEQVWLYANKVSLQFENYPGEGVTTDIQTKAYLYHDDENLYVAVKAYDKLPNAIRANLSDRDKIGRDDSVALTIDTFNDGRNGYEFRVNPMGVQYDARINDDNGLYKDRSWDGIWHSAAVIDEDGWSAEFKIPLRTLRFSSEQGMKTWRFAITRNRPRNVNRELSTYRHDNALKCTLCQFDSLQGFDGVASGRNWLVTPTVTLSRSDHRNDPAAAWHEGEFENELGLDFRWGLSSNMVVNATINPDFSQVEADAPQLNVNNRFSLFVREKRPFFLDGADIFNTRGLTLVHTRNIQSPDYGVKLTGKSDGNSYGLLLANDEQTAFLLPRNQGSSVFQMDQESQIAVGRYKADVGERSTIGVLATARQGDDYGNYVASVDGTYALDDKNRFQYQWAYAHSDNPEQLVQRYNDNGEADVQLSKDFTRQQDKAYSLNYYHDTRNYNLNLGYATTGKDFRADMGFVGQSDLTTWSMGGRRTYYGEKDDSFTRFGYFGSAYINQSTDGDDLSEYYDFRGFANGPMQFFANFGYSGGREEYAGQSFDLARFVSYSTITPMSGVELQLFVGYGKHVDWANLRPARRLDMQATINWQPTKHLSVYFDHTVEALKETEGYQYNRIEIGTGTVYTANQSDLRLTYQFDVKSQLQLTLQYTDIDRNAQMYQQYWDNQEGFKVGGHSRFFSTKLLYSYKVNPQTLVYLGYADGGKQTPEMNRLERDNRSVFAKFSYAWQI